MSNTVPRRLSFSQPDPVSVSSTKPSPPPKSKGATMPGNPAKCCVKYYASVKAQQTARKAKQKARFKAAKLAAQQRGRLPDGAQFVATYDARTMRWTATLTTVVGGEAVVFHENRRGVFAVMGCLDVKYREAVNAASPSADGEEPK